MAYPVSLWAKIKCDYETGNYSIPKLQEKYQIPIDTLAKKLSGKKIKGRLKPLIEKTIQEKYLAAFKKVGITEVRIAKTLSKMLGAEKTVIIPSGQEGQSGFADTVEDWIARDKAVTQVSKLTGSYAAEKVDGAMRVDIPGLADILKKVYPDAE